MSSKTVIAFDLYGTLLSTESIAKQLAEYVGSEAKANEVAALWRRYQLEYSWRMTCMSKYASFKALTLAALNHALAEHSLSLPTTAITSLMQSYDSLSVFPDVPPGLDTLSQNTAHVAAYIFSNGSLDMVGASVEKSEGLKKWSSSNASGQGTGKGLFRELVTIDRILGLSSGDQGGDQERYADGSPRSFKPAPNTYAGLLAAVQIDGEKSGDAGLKAMTMGNMWLVTSNPFDVVGALNAGMKAAWVDRSGKGWIDGLTGVLGLDGPTVVVGGVKEAVERIVGWER
ncbi:HAD-like domain-containing protein [Xylogone sp. PMI_703]|nr:HAD-like domain-containing protein [Xylogone sp. PMI_703]